MLVRYAGGTSKTVLQPVMPSLFMRQTATLIIDDDDIISN
jgi:hypothetical protein